ncbi:MAG: mechanosensitive ion channel [Saprospirales bacterium]|nr:mechanosensitive ion channel [Saprospirales bacterium]MBK8490373.1 mechanosensitive ion channel [Saprospirales bacterium]
MDLFNLEELGKLLTNYAPKVVGAILTLVVGFWIIGRITHMLRKSMEKRGIDPTIRPFLGSLVSVGLKVLLLLSVASMFGIETTSFVAIFSALAFAIGLALQGSLGHFASGVLLLIFKPYKVGDLVTIGGGFTGTVNEIQVFNTVLVTLDNKHIIVPNGVVTSNVMTNISGQGIIGVEFTFSIGYAMDIDKARNIILQVGKECPYILDDPAQGVVVGAWGASSIDLASRPFCKSEHYWDTFFYMNENVKKAFDKEGIRIPFPQMDVHLDK